MMLLTNDKSVVLDKPNSRLTMLGWTKTLVAFSATACLVVTWLS